MVFQPDISTPDERARIKDQGIEMSSEPSGYKNSAIDPQTVMPAIRMVFKPARLKQCMHNVLRIEDIIT